MNIIPIFFTFDRNYLLPARVAIYSLLKYASPKYQYKLYVLHTTLTEKDQQTLLHTLSKFSATLEFINVDQYAQSIDRLNTKAHYSKEIFYKLIAAELFPQYDRMICTDVDVIFTGDIAPSFSLFPEEDFFFAGVGPIENSRMPLYHKQFQPHEIDILEHEIAAGYLLVNLKAIRSHQKQEEIIQFYLNNYTRLLLPEQDCIILTCWPHIKYLPLEYSLPISFYKFNMETTPFYQGNTEFAGNHSQALRKFQKALSHPVQLHYAGYNKPWNSFFLTQQRVWMSMMLEAGCLTHYLQLLPYYLMKRIQRYSLKRFIKKLYKKLK